VLDRVTKSFALNFFELSYPINQYISIQVTINRGISWGLFNGNSQAEKYVFSFVILVFCLAGIYAYLRQRRKHVIIGELLVLIGGLSNILDRIWYVGVIDFIFFHYQSWSFPIFNVADVAIVIGVLIMIGQSLLYEH
jgi:signal peptidase II